MNILVVGNGFDLAHKLPTSYKDCLNFFTMARRCIDTENFEECRSLLWRSPIRMPGFLKTFTKEQINFLKEFLLKSETNLEVSLFRECIKENLWIDHFEAKQSSNRNEQHKWIDFEAEISQVVQATDLIIKEAREKSTPLGQINSKFFSEKDLKRFPYFDRMGRSITTYLRKNFPSATIMEHMYSSVIGLLFEDLQKLTTAVEIYIKLCMQKNSYVTLPDITQIGEIDKVVSFNYTYTFAKYMEPDKIKAENICFIHGTVRKKPTDINSTIVLGIDEYLDEDHRNKDVDWVMFKKSFQRLFKHSDYQYVSWGKDTSSPCPSKLYIWGHSLDITDGDILRELIDQPNRSTTVFYRSDQQLSTEITNLIRILGIDSLNAHARSSPPTIVFKEQQGQE